MSIAYILSQAGAKMGLKPSDADQRLVLLRFLNEAADEVYSQSDMAGSLMEQVFKVNGDQTVALPNYVGQVRGARELNSRIPWKLNQLRPRYNISNWGDNQRTLRIKGKQALQREITNESVLVITTPVIESAPITLTITGRTPLASSINEVLTLNAMSIQTVNNFIEVTALNKSEVNSYDITISDIEGNELAVIPNNEKSSVYQILDVSTCPWLSQAGSNTDHYLEILFKKKLPYLSEDGDEFPAHGYDNLIVNKIMQLWAEEQEKTELALTYDGKASRSLARKHEEENRATQDVVAMVPHPHDSMLPRVRSNYPAYNVGYHTHEVNP